MATLGDAALDEETGELSVRGAVAGRLTPRETEVLALLMRVGQRGCRTEAIHDALYGADPDGGPLTRTVDTFVYEIRKKLRAWRTPVVVVTVGWGRGYRAEPALRFVTYREIVRAGLA